MKKLTLKSFRILAGVDDLEEMLCGIIYATAGIHSAHAYKVVYGVLERFVEVIYSTKNG